MPHELTAVGQVPCQASSTVVFNSEVGVQKWTEPHYQLYQGIASATILFLCETKTPHNIWKIIFQWFCLSVLHMNEKHRIGVSLRTGHVFNTEKWLILPLHSTPSLNLQVWSSCQGCIRTALYFAFPYSTIQASNAPTPLHPSVFQPALYPCLSPKVSVFHFTQWIDLPGCSSRLWKVYSQISREIEGTTPHLSVLPLGVFQSCCLPPPGAVPCSSLGTGLPFCQPPWAAHKETCL